MELDRLGAQLAIRVGLLMFMVGCPTSASTRLVSYYVYTSKQYRLSLGQLSLQFQMDCS